MDERGKVVNMAFAVSASFVLGDHLAYAAGFAPSAILPMMIGKFVAGLSAISVAMLLTKNHKKAQYIVFCLDVVYLRTDCKNNCFI